MRYVICAVLSCCMAIPHWVMAQQAPKPSFWEIGSYSYVDGNNYESIVTYDALTLTPQWDESDPSPPLPAGEALRAARECLAGLDLPIKGWTLESVNLVPAHLDSYWYYEVHFVAPKPGTPPGSVYTTFRIKVLMNGVAVVPRISNDSIVGATPTN